MLLSSLMGPDANQPKSDSRITAPLSRIRFSSEMSLRTSAPRRMSILPHTLKVGSAKGRVFTYFNCEISKFHWQSIRKFKNNAQTSVNSLIQPGEIFKAFAAPSGLIGVCVRIIFNIKALALDSIMKLACDPESRSARIWIPFPDQSRIFTTA